MSLINDALKRAKQAQQQAAPSDSPGPHLRPVEPIPYVRHSVEFLVPATLAVMALLCLFFVWRWANQRGSMNKEERAKVRALTAPAPVPQTVSLPDPPKVAPSTNVHEDLSLASNPSSEAPAIPRQAQPTAVSEAVQADTAATQAVNSAVQEVPKLPPLKLQGIVFSPTRPSAVINGKPLFKGDRIRDFKVVAIGKDSVTLVSPGQTNVLNLPE